MGALLVVGPYQEGRNDEDLRAGSCGARGHSRARRMRSNLEKLGNDERNVAGSSFATSSNDLLPLPYAFLQFRVA